MELHVSQNQRPFPTWRYVARPSQKGRHIGMWSHLPAWHALEPKTLKQQDDDERWRRWASGWVAGWMSEWVSG